MGRKSTFGLIDAQKDKENPILTEVFFKTKS